MGRILRGKRILTIVVEGMVKGERREIKRLKVVDGVKGGEHKNKKLTGQKQKQFAPTYSDNCGMEESID